MSLWAARIPAPFRRILRPTRAFARWMRRSMATRALSRRQAEAKRLYAAGNLMRKDGRLPEAIQTYRKAIELNGRPARYHRGLARALASDNNWEGAVRAFQEAIERRPRAVDHFRLGTAKRKIGDWEGALAAHEEAARLAPKRPKYHLWVGRARSRRKDWNGALCAYERLLSIPGSEADVDALFGVARAYAHLGNQAAALAGLDELREVLEKSSGRVNRAKWLSRMGAEHARAGDHDGARRAFEEAIELEPATAVHRLLYGAGLHSLGDYPAAIVVLSEALEIDSGDPRIHFRLGFAHERLAATTQPDTHAMGLLPETTDGWSAAKLAYRQAIRLEPSNPKYLYRLGTVLLHLGEANSAVAAITRSLDLDGRLPARWWRLGRAISAVGHQMGAHTPALMESSCRALRRALELDPDFELARRHLVRNEIRRANWPGASGATWYPPPDEDVGSRGLSRSEMKGLRSYLESLEEDPDPTPVEEALSLPASRLRPVPIEWWYPLHWRLLSQKHFSLAFLAKDAMAERTIELPREFEDLALSKHLEVVRALAYLDRFDAAKEYLRGLRSEWTSEADQLLIRKIAADVALATGEIDEHVALLDLHIGDSPSPAERHFREMIEGRRVAIVGPADTTLSQGAEIDDYDVIIRTKYLPRALDGHAETAGSRTDLSYYTLGSASILADQIGVALRENHLQMAVFRPSAYKAGDESIVQVGDLRYMPSEYRASFRAAMFAIQRIVYDVVRYRPATVKVFNVNFFASMEEYRTGYRFDPTNDFVSRGFVRPLTAFPHDFRSDFILTRRWVETGLVEVDPVATEILSLEPSEYLALLDRKRLAPDQAGSEVNATAESRR